MEKARSYNLGNMSVVHAKDYDELYRCWEIQKNSLGALRGMLDTSYQMDLKRLARIEELAARVTQLAADNHWLATTADAEAIKCRRAEEQLRYVKGLDVQDLARQRDELVRERDNERRAVARLTQWNAQKTEMLHDIRKVLDR